MSASYCHMRDKPYSRYPHSVPSASYLCAYVCVCVCACVCVCDAPCRSPRVLLLNCVLIEGIICICPKYRYI